MHQNSLTILVDASLKQHLREGGRGFEQYLRTTELSSTELSSAAGLWFYEATNF